MSLTLTELEAAPSQLEFIPRDSFSRAVWISICVHAVLFVTVSVKNVFFKGEPMVYENAIRVDLVALPDKLPPAEEARPQPVDPPPPDVKPSPPVRAEKAPPKELPKQEDAINLEKVREKKEQTAMKKLKQMDAFEKIRKQLEADQRIKAAAKIFKGNQLSNGTELHGLSKLDHDNYIANVKKTIYQNWDLPEWLAHKDLKAQVLARFDERGNLIYKQIIKSSGNPSYDDAIMTAVQKSSPVPVPPEKLTKIIGQEGILIGFPE